MARAGLLTAMACVAFVPLCAHARAVASAPAPRLHLLARPLSRAAAPAMVDDGAADLALLGRRIDELKSVHSL